MEAFTYTDIKKLFELLKRRMAESREWFIELDSALGDGDLGLTMAGGFAEACAALEQSAETSLGRLFVKAGTAIATSAPSTMGTLMASGFLRAGKAIQDKQELGTPEMAAFFEAFVEGVAARGKAQPGEKTVLDSLCPARDALTACAAGGVRLCDALRAAAAASAQGFEKTRDMLGVHGRAAYYQEGSLGKPDPGAAAGVVLMKAFADYVDGQGRNS